MKKCVRCQKTIKFQFEFMCQHCYNRCVTKFRITDEDFFDYLNLSFNVPHVFPAFWRFREMHEYISYFHPTLKTLPQILEILIFFKWVSAHTTWARDSPMKSETTDEGYTPR